VALILVLCQILYRAKCTEAALSVGCALSRKMESLAQLPLLPLHYLASFNLKFAQILSLIPMESILETALTIKQDLFTNYYQ